MKQNGEDEGKNRAFILNEIDKNIFGILTT